MIDCDVAEEDINPTKSEVENTFEKEQSNVFESNPQSQKIKDICGNATPNDAK